MGRKTIVGKKSLLGVSALMVHGYSKKRHDSTRFLSPPPPPPPPTTPHWAHTMIHGSVDKHPLACIETLSVHL